MLKISTLVTLLLGLTVASGQHVRIRRGTRKFESSSSRNYCLDRAGSKIYMDGDTWLQVEGIRVKYCWCNGKTIQCHSVPVQGCPQNKCYNGGKCRQAVYSQLHVCQCSAGYKGPLCEIDTREHCYKGRGTSYRGTWSTAASGKRCLNWNLSAVVRTRFNGLAKNAQQRGLGNHNFCRNPDNDQMPWCHVYDGHVLTWENCGLPACPQRIDLECYTKNGASYRGTGSYSQSGRPCLNWDSEAVRNRKYNSWVPNAHHLGLGSHNYCRNPNRISKPWCNVWKGRRLSVEFCNVQRCSLAAEICGKRDPKLQHFRIMGGASIDITSYPWQAAIFTYHNRSKTWNFQCGGSLVGSCWVLTAAHCFEGRFKPHELKVIMGRTIVKQKSVNEQTLEVEDLFEHQGYDDVTLNQDIALIKLRPKAGKCAKVTRYVRTVCLPQKGQHLVDWTECEISGYGREQEHSPTYSKQLKTGNVRLYPENQCTSALLANRTITRNMLCAGDTRGTDDACKGDSGGPLVCQTQGHMTLQGIISWGFGCGKKGVPGVYTKVVNYLDWIHQHMAKAELSSYKSFHRKQ